MGAAKYNLVLDEYEQGVVVNALNEMRNRLIEEEETTDIVDDVLLKAIRAPKKRFRLFGMYSYESNIR